MHYPKQNKREEQLSSDLQYLLALEDYSKPLVPHDTQSLFTRL